MAHIIRTIIFAALLSPALAGCAEWTVQGHPVGPSNSQQKQIDKDGHCTKPEEGNCF
jgi:hypothetical protein